MQTKKLRLVLGALAMIPTLVSPASCASSKPAMKPAAVASVFYASPSGKGSACTLAAPCSLTGVRDKAREAGAKMTRDIKVVLRGGSYYLSAPLTLTDKDSGKNGHKIVWTNFKGEKPELIGGSRVTGWTLDAGNVYKVNVGVGTVFHTFYENGVRAVKARYPNTGYLQSENGSGGIGEPAYLDAWLQFKSGEVPNWPDIVGGEMSTWGYWDWFQSTIPIAKFDPAARRIALVKPPAWGFIDQKTLPYKMKQNNYDRFFIQGVKSALDVAGEFYLDKAAGVLYYHPRSTAPIAEQTIIVPKMKRVLELKGSSPTALIRNIHFEGIKVSISDFTDSFDPWGDPKDPHMNSTQVNMSAPNAPKIEELSATRLSGVEPMVNRQANVYITNAENITLKTMEIANSGYSGIMLDLTCRKIVVFNSQIHDVGYGGVLFNGVNDNVTDPLISRDNLIQNNHIYNIGQLVGHGAGVSLVSTAYNFINHNEIHTGNRYGVLIAGVYDLPSKRNLASHNLISYNKAYDLNNDSADTANMYQFAGGRYNVWDHNLIYETNGITVNSVIYLDNRSDYVTLSNNIGYDTPRISQNDNYPTITLFNNVLSANPADWAAAGLDVKQMGRVPMTDPVWPEPAKIPAPVAKDYRLNAGRSAVGSFTSDGYFEGGVALGNLIPIDTAGVVNPASQEVYQWARFGPSKYELPDLVASGTYKVRLHFAELTFTAPNQRTFNVAINGERKLTNFDIFAAAGGIGKANVQEFSVKADVKGRITIEFSEATVSGPQVNGIEVLAE